MKSDIISLIRQTEDALADMTEAISKFTNDLFIIKDDLNKVVKLLQDENLKRLMGDAVMEAVKVAELKQIKLSKKDYAASAFDVAEKTSDNKNSMLQDVLKGKKTEIDFINGRIVEYARDLNIKVPINTLLTYLVKGVERSYI